MQEQVLKTKIIPSMKMVFPVVPMNLPVLLNWGTVLPNSSLSVLKWYGLTINPPKNLINKAVAKILVLLQDTAVWFISIREKICMLIPERIRGTKEWDNTYKIRTVVERDINYIKDTLSRRTPNTKQEYTTCWSDPCRYHTAHYCCSRR